MGAPFAGGPLERLVWLCIGRTRQGHARWTDDTQMALDVADSLAVHGHVEADDLAHRFAASYRWSRGYGPGAAKVLRRIRRGVDWRVANRAVYADGSHGNGGAMRAPVVGIFFAGSDDLDRAARGSAEVTHAHPAGQEGAALVAAATASAASGAGARDVVARALGHSTVAAFREQLTIVRDWLDRGQTPDVRTVRATLGNGLAAARSCATAIHAAVRFFDAPFVELQRFVATVRGDADTIGAMAGAIWGAANGAQRLPEQHLARLEQRERIEAAANALHARRYGAAARGRAAWSFRNPPTHSGHRRAWFRCEGGFGHRAAVRPTLVR